MNRKQQFDFIDKNHYDVVIIGAGITGSRLYHELYSRGNKVLLIDKYDFGCGTSQASGMMIWGGLLYLKNLDFKTVRKLCKARDEMISSFPKSVSSSSFRYMPAAKGGRSRTMVHLALMLYWLMGSKKRHFPKGQKNFSEEALIQRHKFKDSLVYEEAFLNMSDSRFVLQWLNPWLSEHSQAINYASMVESNFENRQWDLKIKDQFSERIIDCSTKYIVNASGVWTDQVNRDFGIVSDYKHMLSKGVYMNLKRPENHETSLIFEMGEHGDSQSYVPWGPVSMWGPTETAVQDINKSFYADQNDIQFLLNKANMNLERKVTEKDIVSLRCGIRPLAVRRKFNKKNVYPLDLSRKHLIHKDKHKQFIALYGGKITSCGLIAKEVSRLLPKEKPSQKASYEVKMVAHSPFSGLQQNVPSASWCKENEQCHKIEDYLRRRTNISQWVSNGGFGENFENYDEILKLAVVFHGTKAKEKVDEYKNKITHSVLFKLKDN